MGYYSELNWVRSEKCKSSKRMAQEFEAISKILEHM